MGRLTLDKLPGHIPTPQEIFDAITNAQGWPYKTNEVFFQTRDRALPALLYLGGLRVSEALPIKANDFSDVIKDKRGKYRVVKNVLMSKRREGKHETRDVELPLLGERAKLTQLIEAYLDLLEPSDRLFPWSLEKVKTPNGSYRNKKGELIQRYSVRIVGTARAWQIVKCLMPDITEHWLRAFGEDFFYVLSGKDLVATAHKFKVDPRTLADWYLKRRHMEVIIR